MRDLLTMARQVQRFLDSHLWASCIIGGIAVLRWGEPRLTRDVNVTLLSGPGDEERFVDEIERSYVYRVPNGRDFALTRHVMLLSAEDGTDIDLALGGLPFEERAVKRASDFEYVPGLRLRTCSTEDLVVMKAFAGRELDWADVRGIGLRQGANLDWRLIRAELKPLCELKEAPEIMDQLEQLRRTLEAG